MLNISIEKLCGVMTLKCKGRIVRGDETTILCAAIHQQERELNLDLSEVTTIDAGGIGALRDYPGGRRIDADLIEQRREFHSGPVGARQEAVNRLNVGIGRLRGIEAAGIAGAFDEGDA